MALMRDVFPAHLLPCFKYERMTRMQEHVLRPAFTRTDNMVVCAPTGSGKTTVLEAAFLQQFTQANFAQAKVLYLAPTKALLHERLLDWTTRFGELTIGMKFVELSSDSEAQIQDVIYDANVLLSTPEKWDVITRQPSSLRIIAGMICLMMVDEIHHIGGGSRGAALEAVICRMMNLSRFSTQQNSARKLRIVGLSATFSNVEDVARWLKCSEDMCFKFGNDFRPVPLSVHVFGFKPAKNSYLFDQSLDCYVSNAIRNFSDGKPTLIFCNSRKAAMRLARLLCSAMHQDSTQTSIVSTDELVDAKKISDNKEWIAALQCGVGYHHAALTQDERCMTEKLFCDGKLPILCCTSTLAVGVNLPARLVIIKSTQIYQGASGYVEYPISSILQMIGRAGRASLDSCGTAVILTEAKMTEKYEELCRDSSKCFIESALSASLCEVLNSEIVLGAVSSISDAVSWMKSTFLYESKSAGQNDRTIDTTLEKCCKMAAEKLCAFEMAKLCSATEELKPTVPGMLMSQHYVSCDTMKKVMRLDEQLIGTVTLLRTLSRCSELQHPLRRNEKAILTEINDTRARYRERNEANKHQVDSDEMKSNVLLQAAIGRIDVKDHSLRQEMMKALESAERILKAAIDFLAFKKRGQAVWTALMLWRSMKLRAWDENGGAMCLQQIKGVDSSAATALKYIGIRNIRQLASADVDHLVKFLRRDRCECSALVKNASVITQFAVSTTVASKKVVISVSKTSVNQKGADSQEQTCTILVWSNCELLLFREGVHPPAELEVSVQAVNDVDDMIHVRLMHDQFVGLDEKVDLGMSSILAKTEAILSTSTSKTEQKHASFFDSSQETVVEDVLVHGKRDPEPVMQDSGIMMAIKKLEKHHAKAKQQKIDIFFKQKKNRKPRQLEKSASTDNIKSLVDHFQDDNLTHRKLRRTNKDTNSVSKRFVHHIPSDMVPAKIKDKKCIDPQFDQSIVIDKDYRPKRKRTGARNEAFTNPFTQFTLSNKRKGVTSHSGSEMKVNSSVFTKSIEAVRDVNATQYAEQAEFDTTASVFSRPFFHTYVRNKENENTSDARLSTLDYRLMNRSLGPDNGSKKKGVGAHWENDASVAHAIKPKLVHMVQDREDDIVDSIFF